MHIDICTSIWLSRIRRQVGEHLDHTCVTLSSAWVRRSSAEALSARSWARSSSWDVVIVVLPKVVFGRETGNIQISWLATVGAIWITSARQQSKAVQGISKCVYRYGCEYGWLDVMMSPAGKLFTMDTNPIHEAVNDSMSVLTFWISTHDSLIFGCIWRLVL